MTRMTGRDPFVIWNEEKQEYLAGFGNQKGRTQGQQTGRTVKFTSKDLKNWKFEGDFWAPGLFTMHEMPDLFQIGDWWYHIISEYSDGNKMVYRMSKSLDGPWIAPADDAFDGRAYYAGRTFCRTGSAFCLAGFPRKRTAMTVETSSGQAHLWHMRCIREGTEPWASGSPTLYGTPLRRERKLKIW